MKINNQCNDGKIMKSKYNDNENNESNKHQ